MRRFILFALPLFVISAPASASRAVKVIEPLAPGLAGSAHVTHVDVTVGDTARPSLTLLDEKAAHKRTAAKLAPFDPAEATGMTGIQPTPETYETLPFATMMPLEVGDVTKAWGLESGRPVKLAITIDAFKTADAAMAMLLGSADELAGTVDVLDADTGARLGEFYVDVLNYHAGALGMAVRGSGVREKLAAEFAKHIAEQLNGSTRKRSATKA